MWFGPVSNKSTIVQSVSHKVFLKEEIEVPWILLTTQTNLGKFTVASLSFAQALG